MLRARFDQRNALGRLEFDVPVFKREKVQNGPPQGQPRYLVPARLFNNNKISDLSEIIVEIYGNDFTMVLKMDYVISYVIHNFMYGSAQAFSMPSI